MYRNMNPPSLGVSGRQSELIELTLTYGFRGVDLNAAELLKRATLQGVDEASKYIRSGKVKVGGWTLPARLSGTEAQFKEDSDRLGSLAETAKKVGFTHCTVDLEPAHDDLPYHENFELHRVRLAKAGEQLSHHGIRLGVGLLAAPKLREGKRYQFIHQAEELLLLLRNTASPHVGLALDTWNWKVGAGGMDQLDEVTGDQFVSLVLADVPEDVDLSKIESHQRMLPGEASWPDHARLLKQLADKNFRGPVTIKPHSRQLARMTRDQSVDRCAKAMESMWNLAGLSKTGKLSPATAPAAVEA